MPEDSLVYKAELCDWLGISYPTIWTWMRAGRFPRGIVVGGGEGRIAWKRSEVRAWLSAQPTQRLKGDPDYESPISKTHARGRPPKRVARRAKPARAERPAP